MKLRVALMEKFCHVWIDHGCEWSDWKAVLLETGYLENRSQFHKLMHNPNVLGRIYELQQEAKNVTIMTLRDRLELLTLIAKDTKQSTTQRIAAMNAIHRQSGDDIAQIKLSDEEVQGGAATNVVRMVDVKLPTPGSTEDSEMAGEDGEDGEPGLISELNKLDQFEASGKIDAEEADEAADFIEQFKFQGGKGKGKKAG